jgi:hypothetical protein
MSFLLLQYNYKVNKPIVPTLIHDDTTRLIVIVLGILICGLISYKFMKNFNGI